MGCNELVERVVCFFIAICADFHGVLLIMLVRGVCADRFHHHWCLLKPSIIKLTKQNYLSLCLKISHSIELTGRLVFS